MPNMLASISLFPRYIFIFSPAPFDCICTLIFYCLLEVVYDKTPTRYWHIHILQLKFSTRLNLFLKNARDFVQYVINNSLEATTPFLSYADKFVCSVLPESPLKSWSYTPGKFLWWNFIFDKILPLYLPLLKVLEILFRSSSHAKLQVDFYIENLEFVTYKTMLCHSFY